MNYHNITPVGFFARWEPDVVHGVAWGRAQLAAMADRATSASPTAATTSRS